MSPETEKLVRSYANGELSWDFLRAKGMRNYLSVLGALDELKLSPPKPDLEKQTTARSALRTVLQAQVR